MTLRIDEYVSPVNWDDLEMDWTDPDPTDCKYIHALVLALLERLVVGDGWNSVSFPIISPDIRMKYSSLNTIHNYTWGMWNSPYLNNIRYLNTDEPVTERIIPKTATNAYHPGNYDYHHCELNYWNNESILEAIGDETIISPQSDVFNNQPWLIQQYKIINKLHTHKFTPGIPHRYFKDRIYQVQYGRVTDDRTSDWRNDGDSYTSAIKSAQLYDPMHGSGFVWETQYSRMIKHDIIYSPYFPICDVDLIGFIHKYNPQTVSDGCYFYPNAFNGINCGGYWFEPCSFRFNKFTQNVLSVEFGDLELLPVPGQDEKYRTSIQSYSYSSERVTMYDTAIGKFNFNFLTE